MLKSKIELGGCIVNLSNIGDDFFFTSVKESSEESHSHPHYEILYVTSGKAEFFADKGVSLSIGNGIIVAPDFSHAIKSDSVDFLYREIFIDVKEFDEIAKNVSPDDSFIDKLTKNRYFPFTLSKSEIDFIENKLYSIHLYPEENDKKGFTNSVMSALIGSAYYSFKVSTLENSDFSKKCLTLCHSYFSDNEASDKIRKAFPYNDVYFGRKFKECFNCSLLEYLTKLRMETAVYYILNMPFTIEEICNMVGIYSVAHFIKLFKKFYGTTPYKYKAEHRKATTRKRSKN
jgi:AraC-like DNA-binding protein